MGAGFVGGPSSTVIALKNPKVHVVVADLSSTRIDAWNSESMPMFEPQLDDLIKQVRGRNLFFTDNVDKAIYEADMIFISVGTLTKTDGRGKDQAFDMSNIEAACRQISQACRKIELGDCHKPVHKIIVEKSTLCSNLSRGVIFEVVSNPEFLAEGSAINDLLYPNRVLIGSLETPSGLAAARSLASLYEPWVSPSKIVHTNLWSSELSKLATNALLAQRVSSINAISALCEATGADIDHVSYACGLDARLGDKFLKAGLGFGGSCFRKDVSHLVYMSESLGLREVAQYWSSVISLNNYQKDRFVTRITQCLGNTLSSKRLAVLGFSYKPQTSDTRESPAIDLVTQLLAQGAIVSIYDPKVNRNQIMSDLIDATNLYAAALTTEEIECRTFIWSDVYSATRGSCAIVIATGWQQLGTTSTGCDWKRIYGEMIKPAWVFDGRCFLNEDILKNIGFRVETVGRQSSSQMPSA